jgi:hypothetical protein
MGDRKPSPDLGGILGGPRPCVDGIAPLTALYGSTCAHGWGTVPFACCLECVHLMRVEAAYGEPRQVVCAAGSGDSESKFTW